MTTAILEFRKADLRFLPGRNTFRQGVSRAATLHAGAPILCQSTETDGGHRLTTTMTARVAFVAVGELSLMLSSHAALNHLVAENSLSDPAGGLHQALLGFYPQIDLSSLVTVIGFADERLARALDDHFMTNEPGGTHGA